LNDVFDGSACFAEVFQHCEILAFAELAVGFVPRRICVIEIGERGVVEGVVIL
jgi:hypothetical protein